MLQQTWKPTAAGVLTIIGGTLDMVAALASGTSSLRRKHWGLGLAGSICAIMPPLMTLGILSTVWIAISRNEFS